MSKAQIVSDALSEAECTDPCDGMRLIRGGEFLLGSDRHYPEEGPTHRVRLEDFWIDETPVTNAQFAKFVASTNYVTTAEKPPNAADYPGILPDMLQAASLVFVPPSGPVALTDFSWWHMIPGADWLHPRGPTDSIDGRECHPVVHISFEDAEAFALWAGKALPSESEWEVAARGGLEGADYAWGSALEPDGRRLANYWQGEFPWRNIAPRNQQSTSAVRSFPANGYELYDMIGNVWEWTSDWYGDHKPPSRGCCVPVNPRGGSEAGSYDADMPDFQIGRRVLKGGSHLCAPNYCQRYRPSARLAQPVDTSTSHVGFRCIVRRS